MADFIGPTTALQLQSRVQFNAPQVPETPLLHFSRARLVYAIPNASGTQTQPQTISLRRMSQNTSEVLGYSRPSGGVRAGTFAFARFSLSLILSLTQIIAIIIVTARASVRVSPVQPLGALGQSELDACTSLGLWNILWLVRLLLRCYSDSWFLYRGWQSRRSRAAARQQTLASHALSGFDLSLSISGYVCPFNSATLPLVIHKTDLGLTFLWLCIDISVLGAHGKLCYLAAYHLSVITYTITALVVVYYLPTIGLQWYWDFQARQRGNQHEIGPLTQEAVDRISLVLYIPPPIDLPAIPLALTPHRSSQHQVALQPNLSSLPTRWGFIPSVRRKQTRTEDIDIERGPQPLSPVDERVSPLGPAEYSFVCLPANQAGCSIYLLDFEATRRPGPTPDTDRTKDDEAHEMTSIEPTAQVEDRCGVAEARVESAPPGDAHAAGLANSDSDDAPTPLRLLGCGHVFHKHCLDRWLTEYSGRCPCCQARVEVLPPPRKRGGRRK